MHNTLIRFFKRNHGYNLLQMAIALLIIGLLATPMAGLYFLYEKNMRIDKNFLNVESTLNAIQNYRKLEGVYPCPAPIDSARDNAAHGNPTACRGGPIAALAAGTCGDGVCIEQSIRAGLANRRVIVGAIPFRLLQIDESQTIDAYGSRILYVVTESLTDPLAFNDANGGIAVHDETGTALTTPDGSAGFVVLSHGANRIGGYTADGVAGQPCAGAGLDRENCSTGATDSLYVSALQSDSLGPPYFDDVVSYFSQISDPVWRRTTANPENIQDLSNRNVGVGTAAPGTELDISSANDSIAVRGATGTDGQIMANQICDQSGANCFDPAVIGGDVSSGDGMQCPAGQYMLGIENGGPRCGDVAVQCPAATPVLVGVDAAGDPVCRSAPMAGCAATPMTLCAPADVALAAATDTFISATFNAGACRTARYQCNNGTWSEYSSAGLCGFTPVVTTTPGQACGPGYTGTYTTTTTTQCTGGTTTTSTAPGDCTCIGGTFNETEACSIHLGSNYTGNATRTTTYTPPACTAASTPWDLSACSCTVPAVTTRWIDIGACPAGYTGGPIRRQEVFNPATCGWVDNGVVDNNCACNTASQTTTAPHSCADPVCEEPHPTDLDIFRVDINPATCTALPPVLQTAGSCRAKNFRWQMVGTTGVPAASLPPNARYVGTGCSCADHVATSGASTEACFISTDPANIINRCKCQ